MSHILVLTTVGSEELAHKIAGALVESREAACVNIVPGVRSIYRWEGKVCDDRELLLLIKSSAEKFEAIRTRIRALHSYQVPEIVSLSLSAGDADYLGWLEDQVRVGH